MFEPTSRYYNIEDAAFTTTNGTVTYKRRRFPPQGEAMRLLVEVKVVEEGRLDLIAAGTIGDPEQFWRICDANNALNPFDLEQSGRMLRVPIPEVHA